MATDNLKELYDRYKSGNKHFLQWLVETVISYTAVPALVRARQQGNLDEEPIILSARDIKQCVAEVVAQARLTQRLPIGFRDNTVILESVVRDRRECATWCGIKDEVTEEDQTHEFFNTTPQSALKEMKNIAGDARSNVTISTAPASESSSINRFVGLPCDLQDEKEQTPAAWTTAEASTQKPSPVREIQVKLEDTDLDKRLAVLCYLEECHTISHTVSEAWQECAAGSVSASSAHVVEGEANFLLQIAAAALIREHSEFRDFSTIAEYLQLDISVNDGNITNVTVDIDDNSGRAGHSVSTFPSEAWLSLRLLQFRHQHPSCGAAPADGSDSRMSDQISRHLTAFDSLGLSLLRWEAAIRGLADRWQEPKDFFLSHYVDFLRQGCQQISLDIVASLQMRLMGLQACNSLGQGLPHALLRVALRAKEDFTATEECLSKLGPFMRRRASDIVAREIKKIEHDILEAARLPLKKVLNSTFEESERIEQLLVSDMYGLCTGYISDVVARLHTTGIQLLNVHGIGLAMAHLYTACRKIDLIESWEDMDFFIESQGSTELGLRGVDSSKAVVLEMTKHLGLAMGVDFKQYSKTKLTAVTIGKITLPPPAKLPSLVHANSSRILKRDQAGTIARNSGFDLQGRHPALLHDIAKEVARNDPESLDPSIIEKLHNKKTLTSPEMLSALKCSVKHDDLAVHFDHISFFADLCSLINKIQTAMTEIPGTGNITKTLSATSEPSVLVHEIFKAAAKRESHLASNASSGFPDVLGAATTVFKAHTEQCGSKLHDAAAKSIRAIDPDLVEAAQQNETGSAAAGSHLVLRGSELIFGSPSSISAEEIDLVM